MDAIAGQIGFLILFNLIFSLSAANVSIGAHLGGLVGGSLCALAIVAGERGMLGRHHRVAELLAIAAVAVISVVGAIAIA
jgi:membrane associated rhomboid family serine protease